VVYLLVKLENITNRTIATTNSTSNLSLEIAPGQLDIPREDIPYPIHDDALSSFVGLTM
jgi:hypothetical protein